MAVVEETLDLGDCLDADTPPRLQQGDSDQLRVLGNSLSFAIERVRRVGLEIDGADEPTLGKDGHAQLAVDSVAVDAHSLEALIGLKVRRGVATGSDAGCSVRRYTARPVRATQALTETRASASTIRCGESSAHLSPSQCSAQDTSAARAMVLLAAAPFARGASQCEARASVAFPRADTEAIVASAVAGTAR